MLKRLSVVFLALGIIASVALYIHLLHEASLSLEKDAATIAATIAPDEITPLEGSQADLTNPTYANLKAKLLQYRVAHPEYRFIYVIGKKENGAPFFYADSEDASSPDYSPPGQAYPEATSQLQEVLDGKDSGSDESTDRWGSWSSGYAPIREGTTTVAVLGVDQEIGSKYSQSMRYAALPLIGSIVAILLFMISRAWFVRRTKE